MDAKEVLDQVREVKKLSSRVPARAVAGGILADSEREVASQAKRARLYTEAAAVERDADRLAHEAAAADKIEQQLVKTHPGLRSTSETIRAAHPRCPDDLATLYEQLTGDDRDLIARRAAQLASGRTLRTVKDVARNMAGDMRELIVKIIPEVAAAFEGVEEEITRQLAGRRNMAYFDSAVTGAVRLPTRELSDGERQIQLGTDRIAGYARAEPTKAVVTWSDGTSGKVAISGVVDMLIACEIKDRRRATGGVAQLRSLRQEGRGTRGYARIGRQLWLLNYDPEKVLHLLVAPPGTLDAARAALAESRLPRYRIIEIPQELDNQLIGLSRAYLEAAVHRP